MKSFIIVFLSFITCYSQELTKTELLKNVKSFTLDTINYKIEGDGFEFLKQEINQNQYFLMGEYHNSSLVSKLTQSLFPYLKNANYNVWITEISPTSVKKLNSFLDSDDFTKKITDFNKKYGKNNSPIPFFSSQADYEMLLTSRKNNFELWGLDQHYFGGFQFVIDDTYNSLDAQTKAKYPTLIEDSKKQGDEGDKAFMKIFDLSKNKLAKKIKAEMLASASIYGDYSAGNYFENNTVRSTLMKTNFYNYYNDFTNKYKKDPKAFFKFGSNHMAKGVSPIGIMDLGDCINQMATLKNQKSLHVQLCYRYEKEKNEMIDRLNSGVYPVELLELYKEDNWIVLDLRPFHAKLYNLQLKKDAKIEFSKEMIECIKQFDILILSPEKVK
ncbi:hypothetical protein OX283_012930 [Flavobacterium sp. SUN052]|uniref:hypothetical protein n=1 Tax=Flavobacterium sp. SUN052 TaxID=3002441 RepID=UPI00237E55A7|nr:hypothetical protein [Flavobacterium sp. SUN052]MEC4005567.1 hypothetical protein [Flavobacterium sp. SUN052]